MITRSAILRRGRAGLTRVNNSVVVQVYVAPFVLAVPLAGLAYLMGLGEAFNNFWWIATGVALVIAIAAGVYLAYRSERPQEFGAALPDRAAVEVLVTWMSHHPDRKRELALLDLNTPPERASAIAKAVGYWKPTSLVVIVSAEAAAVIVNEPDPQPGKVAEVLEEALDHSGCSVYVVLGPHLSGPESIERLVASRKAIAAGIQRARRRDANAVLADITGGTAPASIALYEAATEEGVATMWWSSQRQEDGSFTYGEPISIVGLAQQRKASA